MPTCTLWGVPDEGKRDIKMATPPYPVTDAEKIADALRAAPNFITDGATILDYPASKGGEDRVLHQGPREWTCLSGPSPGSKNDDAGCFGSVFFQWVKDRLAGRSTSKKLASAICICGC